MRSMLKNLFPIKKRPLINLTVFQQPLFAWLSLSMILCAWNALKCGLSALKKLLRDVIIVFASPFQMEIPLMDRFGRRK